MQEVAVAASDTNPKANIAQVEFFHVGSENSSYEEFCAELKERVKDDLELALQGHIQRRGGHSSIKTAVRFFDESGRLSEIALKAEQEGEQHKRLRNKLISASGLWQWIFDIRYRRHAGKLIMLRRDARILAVEEFREAVRTRREIAVECLDHSFRFAERDEMHDLVESASKSVGAWLFVFHPNDLLAERNTPVASFM